MAFFSNKKQETFYYRDIGRGDPIVLLNGLTRSSRHWLGFDEALAKHYRVLALDCRGIGRTRASMHWSHGLPQLAADVIALLDHLQIEQATVVGLSMGGMVGMCFASRYPDRIGSLVVINSSIANDRYRQVSGQTIWHLATGCMRGAPLDHALASFLVSSTGSELEHIKQAWKTFAGYEPVQTLTVLRHLLAIKRFHSLKALKRIDVPTLVLQGVADRLVDPRNSDLLAATIPNATLESIPSGPHEMTVCHRDAVAEAVCSFLDAAPATESTS